MPEDGNQVAPGVQSTPGVDVARINMWQAVLVALISAFAGIVSTVIVKQMSSDKPDIPKSMNAAGTPNNAVGSTDLHFAYRWVYMETTLSNQQCLNAARKVLLDSGASGILPADSGSAVFGKFGSTGVVVACKPDRGVALITMIGSERQSLLDKSADIKARIDIQLQAH